MTEIRLPYKWQPRPHQDGLWNYLMGGGKRAIEIAHRRFGKDEVALHWTCTASLERVGSYVHFLPEYAQARKALWGMVNPHSGKLRIDEVFPPEMRSWTRDQEMSIGLKWGSTWQLAGSDNYDSHMGSSYLGMTFSEYALGNPAAWGYFSPIVRENDGWAVFITTPRGHNHAERMYRSAAKDPKWWAEIATAEQTGVFTREELDTELRGLQDLYGEQFGKSLWLQEYFCSFDAAIPGSVWGDCIDKLNERGMIGAVPMVVGHPVHTAWDLGRTDATAIWWFQVFAGEVRILRYHESNLKDIPFYCDLLRNTAKEAGYTYGTHWLPHDARARTLAAGGKSIHQQMISAQVGRIVIAPRLDHMDGIQAARATFPFCYIDREACADGIEVLKNYHYEWDEVNRVFTRMPCHDWSSHGSSAFRTLALCWRAEKGKARSKDEKPTPAEALLRGSITGMTFGQLRDKHLRRKKAERHPF